MQLELSAEGVELTEALRDHVERRIRFALGKFAGRIERVHVRLADENGHKGGVGKMCRIRVRMVGFESVAVQQIDADIRTAIDCALDRAGRTVARRIDRTLTVLRDRGVGNPMREKP